MHVDIEKRVKKVMADIFSLPVDQIGPEFSVKTSDLWDSAHHINLIIALEQEFKVKLPDDAVVIMFDYQAVLNTVNGVVSNGASL